MTARSFAATVRNDVHIHAFMPTAAPLSELPRSGLTTRARNTAAALCLKRDLGLF